MILVQLKIVDFKQFAGEHDFTPSPTGVIAVIGHNGAGKTSLFEAIEWCLYQPRAIQADDVFPRGKASNPRVELTLEHPETGERFVIVRRLKASKVADAEIYHDDEATSTIVKGPRQVTDYVARTLIGLSHRAFVSTFFTRQKELTFFGDLKETDRRREVGRLLGMETIREAQKLIGDERAELQGHARSLTAQHGDAMTGRDFEAEANAAADVVQERETSLAAAEERLSEADAAHSAARAEVERVLALERADGEVRSAIERLDGESGRATARRDAAEAELGRIDDAAAKRESLLPVAASLDRRQATLSALDRDKERFDTRRRLLSDIERAEKTIRGAAAELEHTVAKVRAPDVDQWRWAAADSAAPLKATRRLLAVAESVDVDAAGRRAAALLDARTFAEQAAKADADATRYRTHLDKLANDHAALLAAGDPRTRLDAAREERNRAFGEAEGAKARLPAIIAEVDKVNRPLAKLLAREPGALCPECARPFDEAETATAIEVFRARLAELNENRKAMDKVRTVALARVTALDEELCGLEARTKHIADLSVRIETGGQVTLEAEQTANERRRHLADHLELHGLPRPPSPAEIDAASNRYESCRAVAGTAPLLRRIGGNLRDAHAERDDATAALSELGEITYDAAAHDIARADVKSAERAIAQIAQIDTLLAARPERAAEIATANAEIERASQSRIALLAQRAEIGFDSSLLAAARDADASAMRAERDARDARAEAKRAVDEAVNAQTALLNEHGRIQRLVERADAAARDADRLDLMYKEFNLFEQFVADRLTPALSEYTSELLGAITDGKYDQVWFNSNYGIEVYDGVDEKFPSEEFSGGERDLIALCARLALSRLIGAQARNPPGFMVMDEVFGSLDRDRRSQLLDTFGDLAGTADAFRQLFIISHVDDVRMSPIFNEVWRVSESADGTSTLENLNRTGGFDDA